MKKVFAYLFILGVSFTQAQVGINTTTPNAQLDIRSSSQAAPANTDGILIPKINTFPATNPGVDQNGMMVFLTTTVGSNIPGFYYWEAASTTWIPLKGKEGGTLDEAYDFGGPGAGNTIIADAGAVTIAGTDGLVSTGVANSGALMPSGAGVRMVWNPRKRAFRAGQVNGNQWDDDNVGSGSVAFGSANIASGNVSAAFGSQNTASGSGSVAFGLSNLASGLEATAFGNSSNATGNYSTAFGAANIASGIYSTAFGALTSASGSASTAFGRFNIALGSSSTVTGRSNTASSFGETVVGIGSTTYILSTNGATEFRAANATDRLFVIGNAIDANNNNSVDIDERSDAMIVLKNGLTRLPSMDNDMIDAADGKTVVTKEYLQDRSSGTLDQAYDFGGPGVGNTIIADAGAVTIAGTDGLVSTGNEFTGVEMPSGSGTRMVWNPRKGAFRVGTVTDSRWDDSNVGRNSVAMGFGNTASGQGSTAFGGGSSIASGAYSTSFGSSTTASGSSSLASCFFTVASGDFSAAFNRSTTASGVSSASFGDFSTASGAGSLSAGLFSSASGHYSASIGSHNTASSYGETVIGIGATTYTPSSEGALRFTTANATDRLFVIGNAIDANNNAEVDDSERSDAMVVLKNGNIGLGTSTPQTRLEVVSPNIITTGTTRGNLHVMSNDPQDIDVGGAISLGGFNDNAASTMRVFGSIEGRKANGVSTISSGYLAFKTSSIGGNLTERMRINNTGNVGIGTQDPQVRTHISGSESRVTLRLENTAGNGVGIDFLRVSDASTDWRIYNLGPFLTIGNSGDDLATVNDLYQFQGPRFMPLEDATKNLGQGTNRWNTLFASNGTINTSDAGAKKNIQNLNYGLNALMQFRPVSFEWKKEDGSGTKLGLIAQELQQVVPEVVRDWDWEEDEMGNLRKVSSPILGVYYSDLIPVLIKGIQEQQQLIQQQEQQLSQQQTLLGQLLEQQQQLLQRLEKLEQQK